MIRVGVGVDPGVGRAGVFIGIPDNDDELVGAATFTSTKTEYPHGTRVIDLADVICDWIMEQVFELHDPEIIIDLGIETPILNVRKGQDKIDSVKNYSLQWRLVQAIIDVLPWATCSELHNTALKKAATGRGDADKDAIIAVSPFSPTLFGTTGSAKKSVEAIADAWAAYKCIRRGPCPPVNYTARDIWNRKADGQRPLACTTTPIHEVYDYE